MIHAKEIITTIEDAPQGRGIVLKNRVVPLYKAHAQSPEYTTLDDTTGEVNRSIDDSQRLDSEPIVLREDDPDQFTAQSNKVSEAQSPSLCSWNECDMCPDSGGLHERVCGPRR